MHRVNEYRFYDLGQKLAALNDLGSETSYKDALLPLWGAREVLDKLLTDPVPLRICRPLAEKLLQAVNIIPRDFNQALTFVATERLLDWQAFHITRALREFEPVLSAECDAIDTYVVSKKGIYSTSDLIENAEEALSEEAREILPPQVIQDFREAGRCLAFDADTACGFHLMRATEGAIHEYYVAATGHTPKRKDRNWGAYVRNFNAFTKRNPGSDVNPKLVALIDQIREHHRNVLMHPEETLNPEEALVLFGICQSAIMAFADGLKVIREEVI